MTLWIISCLLSQQSHENYNLLVIVVVILGQITIKVCIGNMLMPFDILCYSKYIFVYESFSFLLMAALRGHESDPSSKTVFRVGLKSSTLMFLCSDDFHTVSIFSSIVMISMSFFCQLIQAPVEFQ